jgi:mannose-6-phosphate isomerase-like protein (cupin superfamily)
VREVVCPDLSRAIGQWRDEGFRLDVIYPADDPSSAVLSRGADVVRLTINPALPVPDGTLPPFAPAFLLTRGGASGEGRAGMHYRDLIPGRLGGRYIASHITIAEGGPVSDWVHYHRVAFQMIFVRSGWVRVVYEDQGEPLVMKPGDLVLQPPGIRHRVLESSAGLEVIEIGAPALHETLADHDQELPNDRIDPDRLFNGQRFLRHVASDAPWTGFASATAQETAMAAATNGLADVRMIEGDGAVEIRFPPHDGELVFGFVLDGAARLELDTADAVHAGDAFVVPPSQPWSLREMSPDFRMLHVTTARLG